MPHRQETIGRTNLALAVAAILFVAPLATPAIVETAKIAQKPIERGYLLYPRSGICAPTGGGGGAAAGPAAGHRHSVFRPARSRKALMPPDLGQRLNAEWLRRSGVSLGE